MVDEPKEKLHITAEYTITGKHINYTIFAIIMGIFGYSHYEGGGDRTQIDRPDNAYRIEVNKRIVELRVDVNDLKKNIAVVTAMIAKDNLKVIKKAVK